MARPRKGTEEVWYDTFSEWPEDDRAAALKVLTHLHRALSRKERRTPEPEQIEMDPDRTEDLTAGYNSLPGAAADARESMRRSNGGA